MKKKIIAVIAVVCIGGAAVFAGLAINNYFKDKNAGSSYEEVREEVKKPTPEPTAEAAPEPTAEPTPEATPEPEKEPIEVPIDFDALHEINQDIYAWITIPGTDVDYPIVQDPEEDEFYLHRNIYKEDDFAGAIFTEKTYNTKTFEDANTVIYGHRMKNGTMFHTLNMFEDKAFFDTNNQVIIYMPDKILHYTVFAAYLYDTRHLMQNYVFENPQVFKDYIEEVYSNRDMMTNLNRDIEVKPGDKIITLSTCYAADSSNRWLVQAVLTETEE